MAQVYTLAGIPYVWQGDCLVKALLGARKPATGPSEPKWETSKPPTRDQSASGLLTNPVMPSRIGLGSTYNPDSAESRAASKLFTQANQAKDSMHSHMTNAAAAVGAPDAKVVNMLKRDDFNQFTAGVKEKVDRQSKRYATVDRMPDMVRGRISVDTPKQVRQVVAHLQNKFGDADQGGQMTDFDHPAVRKETGYPRFHSVIRDPQTGIKHEIQVGTKDTDKLLHESPVKIPANSGIQDAPEMERQGMAGHSNFHDVWFDIFGEQYSKQNSPEVWQRYNLHDFEDRYKKTLALSGAPGAKAWGEGAQNPTVRHQRYQQMADELSGIVHAMHQDGYPFGSEKHDPDVRPHSQKFPHATDTLIGQVGGMKKVKPRPKVR